MATLNFNAAEVEPQADMTPVPAGEYKAIIEASDLKSTKAGDGHYLELIFSIVDGEFKNRKIWDRLNIDNKNDTAKEIAQRALSAICHAVGVMQVKDSQQLHNKPMIIKVAYVPESVNKNTGQTFNAKNEVKAYKPINGKTTAQTQQKPAAQAQAEPETEQPEPAAEAPADTGTKRKPWEKKNAA